MRNACVFVCVSLGVCFCWGENLQKFHLLQVVGAAFVSFANGANDTANAKCVCVCVWVYVFVGRKNSHKFHLLRVVRASFVSFAHGTNNTGNAKCEMCVCACARVYVFAGGKTHKFHLLQVVGAAFVSFAHGANDTANALGPFAAIISIYRDAEITKKVDVPIWMLACGGATLSLGLLTYGQKIIKRKKTSKKRPLWRVCEFY